MIKPWLKSVANRLKYSPLITTIERLLVIFALFVITTDLVERQAQHINQAWGIVATNAPGNSGKIQALEYLNSQSCWRVLSLKVLNENCAWFSWKRRLPLNGIDLRSQSDQDGPYLQKINLEGAALYGAHLVRAYLVLANLKYLKAERINLQYASLYNSDMSDANLLAANLRFAKLFNVNLEGASLQDANLEGAFLKGASLQDTYLGKSHLRGAIGLTCEQLTKAKDWFLADRDTELACGKDIPDPPPEMLKWVPKNDDSGERP